MNFSLYSKEINHYRDHFALKLVFLSFFGFFNFGLSAQNSWISLEASDVLYSIQLPENYGQKIDSIEIDGQNVYLYHFFAQKNEVWYHFMDIHYPYSLDSNQEEEVEDICKEVHSELLAGIAEKERAEILFSEVEQGTPCESSTRMVCSEENHDLRIKIFTLKNRALILKVSGNSDKVNHQSCDHFFDGLKIADQSQY